MRVELSRADMLRRCRIGGGLEPVRHDFDVEITDGVDVDAALSLRLRDWYLALLDKGDRSLLAPDDISGAVSLATITGGCADGTRIIMPDMCRRVFDVKLRGWLHAVEVLPADEFDRVKFLQFNPYTAATAATPVAVFMAGAGGGAAPDVAAWPAAAEVVLVNAAMDPGEELYVMDEAALGTLPDNPLIPD